MAMAFYFGIFISITTMALQSKARHTHLAIVSHNTNLTLG